MLNEHITHEFARCSGFDAGFSEFFTATVEVDGTVTLQGELDISGIGALRAALDQALLAPEPLIMIDTSSLSFIDARAISELLRYQLIASSRRQRILLQNLSPQVARALDILDLSDVLAAPLSAEPGQERSEEPVGSGL